MRSSRSTLLGLVAAVAAVSGHGLVDSGHQLKTAVRRRYTPRRDTEQQREIADWNEAVERRKAEKKAKKRAAGVKEPGNARDQRRTE